MAVIIANMDVPQNCNKCGCHNECGCCDFGDDIHVDYEATKRPLDCPLKSADELKNEIIDKSWNIDMYDSDLDFECVYLSDVLKIVDKYCEGGNTDGSNN